MLSLCAKSRIISFNCSLCDLLYDCIILEGLINIKFIVTYIYKIKHKRGADTEGFSYMATKLKNKLDQAITEMRYI